MLLLCEKIKILYFSNVKRLFINRPIHSRVAFDKLIRLNRNLQATAPEKKAQAHLERDAYRPIITATLFSLRTEQSQHKYFKK